MRLRRQRERSHRDVPSYRIRSRHNVVFKPLFCQSAGIPLMGEHICACRPAQHLIKAYEFD